MSLAIIVSCAAVNVVAYFSSDTRQGFSGMEALRSGLAGYPNAQLHKVTASDFPQQLCPCPPVAQLLLAGLGLHFLSLTVWMQWAQDATSSIRSLRADCCETRQLLRCWRSFLQVPVSSSSALAVLQSRFPDPLALVLALWREVGDGGPVLASRAGALRSGFHGGGLFGAEILRHIQDASPIPSLNHVLLYQVCFYNLL